MEIDRFAILWIRRFLNKIFIFYINPSRGKEGFENITLAIQVYYKVILNNLWYSFLSRFFRCVCRCNNIENMIYGKFQIYKIPSPREILKLLLVILYAYGNKPNNITILCYL